MKRVQIFIILSVLPSLFIGCADLIGRPFIKQIRTKELIDLGKGYCVISGKKYPLEVKTGKADIEMVLIKPGEFMMGSPVTEEGRVVEEGPRHLVKISRPFYLGKFEVTQAQYHKVMGYDRSYFPGDSNPVQGVRWEEAIAFCRKIGGGCRLPTEAEWEYACRAGTTTPFSSGETISTDQANYCGHATYGNGRKGVYRGRTTPVGTFGPNGWGLYDMHGNVWEWCSDWYSEHYYRGRPYPDIDPQGPPDRNLAKARAEHRAEYKVVRGGSWLNPPRALRSAARSRCTVDFIEEAMYNFGFRIAWDTE